MNNDLDDKEIEIMLKYVPKYTEDNARNIKAKFLQKSKIKQRKISFKKWALVGTAASMILTTSLSYAGIIDISKVYKIIFGEKSEYLESYIEPIHENQDKDSSLSIQSEHDGIVIKLISAVNDEDALRIFATVTDTKGDRLGEDLDFTSWGLSQGTGGNVSVVDYNNQTKTATVMITSSGSEHEGNATLKVNGISTGRELVEDIEESSINIGELLKGHTPNIISQDEVWKNGGSGEDNEIYEKSRLLKYDEMDIPFDNVDMFSISNIGFVDGLFHMQAKAKLSGAALVDGYYIDAKLVVDPEKKTAYESTSRIDFIADKKYAYESHRREPHDAYVEMIYPNITSPEQLKDLSIHIEYMKSPDITEGTWEFSFVIPEKIKTDFKVDREISINSQKLKINMISLSPIAVTIHLHQNMSSDYNHKDVVSVEYIDGTITGLDQSSIQTYEDESTLVFRGDIIEIEKVKNILINDERISITQ